MSTVTIDTERLRWVCDRCHRAVGDGAGYVHVSYDDINEHELLVRQWRARVPESGLIPGNLLMEHPDRIHWRVHHLRCDPNPDAADYAIRVERIRGHDQLLRWTAHLMGKTWIGRTNWHDVIREAANCDA